MAQREDAQQTERTLRGTGRIGASTQTEASLTELLDRIRVREADLRRDRDVVTISVQLQNEINQLQSALKQTIDERDELERQLMDTKRDFALFGLDVIKAEILKGSQ